MQLCTGSCWGLGVVLELGLGDVAFGLGAWLGAVSELGLEEVAFGLGEAAFGLDAGLGDVAFGLEVGLE